MINKVRGEPHGLFSGAYEGGVLALQKGAPP
jgi:hypothetical protein